MRKAMLRTKTQRHRKLVVKNARVARMFIAIILTSLLALYTVGMHLVINVGATASTSQSFDTDTHFNTGTYTSSVLNGTGTGAKVQLTNTPSVDTWYNASWQYRRKITFNNSAQAENLTNFPVLINLKSTNFDFSKARSAGQDIRFTDSDGVTALNYEIELWDQAGQKGVVWVKVPQIDASSSTDYIYVYYGNNAANDAQNASAVWSNGYVSVFHMNTNPSSSLVDSTGNGHTTQSGGSMGSGNVVDGKVGKAIDFDGADDYIYINPKADLNINTGFVQAWGKKDTDGFGTWLNGLSCDIEWGVYNNIFEVWTGGDCAAGAYVADSTMSNSHVWNLFGYEGRTNGNKVFINGAQVTPTYSSGSASTPLFLDDATPQTYGLLMGTVQPSSEQWDGQLDEERISNVVRSAAWIAADYASMNDTFATYGSEQIPLATSGTWESSASSNVIDTVWNGGWGDGTSGSTAFSATIANVGSTTATIAFQMRTATTTSALTSAPYLTLGTASSGTTFTRTKAQLDALGLSTGSNRYIQVKVTLTNIDGVTNPQLDSFTVYYLRDNTAPEVNASSIQMQKFSGGAAVASNGWTNNLAPYFSWNAASDSQAGLKGYCLYLGTDSAGDPTASKGLLGTSPISISGTNCQFIVSATSIDFADANLRGGTWLTSSSSPYYINIRAIDIAGNVTGSSAQLQFRFDNTVPNNPAYISLPGDFISSKDATFTWPTAGGDAANDTHSGVAGIQYRIGSGGTWYGDAHDGSESTADLLTNDGTYTTDATYDYPVLVNGTNVIYIRTWDNAGNVTTSYTTGALKINTVSPTAPLNLQVTPSTNTTNSYAVSWDPPASFSGAQNKLTYCYTVNILPSAQNCAFTAAGVTSLSTDAYATQPGNNTIYVVARDEATNINYATYASATFSYTGSAPGIAQNVEVSDISVKATSNWRLVVTWDTPTNIGAGVKEYKVYRGITNTSCSSDIGSFSQVGTTAGKSYTDNGLVQQTYYYCVKVCDSANNCSAASATRSAFPSGKFTEPSNLTSGPVSTNISTRKAQISWSTDRDSDSKVAFGVATNSYNLEEPSKPDQTTDHQITLNNLKPGTTYFYRTKWTDSDGNTGISEEKYFTTQGAPLIKDVTIGNLSVDSALLSFTSVRAYKAKVYYGKTTSFGGASELQTAASETRYTVQLKGLEDNTKYFYKINPFDSEGNEYEGTVLEFTTLPRPRISTVRIQEVKGEAQPTVEVSWTSNTEVSSVVSYYPSGRKAAEQQGVDTRFITGEHKLTLRGLNANAEYELVVKGRDRYGNEGSSDVQHFNTGVDTRPPRIFNIKIEGAIVNPTNNVNEKPSSQLIISWDTDEPGTSQVEYNEGTGTEYTQSTQRDNSLTYNHLVIISKLEPSKVYHLRVVSRDEVGNEGKSVDSVTITPKASESALEIVVKNLRDIFNFL
jgi:hypothetical protein